MYEKGKAVRWSQKDRPDHLDPGKKNEKAVGFILSVAEKPLENFEFINKDSVLLFSWKVPCKMFLWNIYSCLHMQQIKYVNKVHDF